jgi:hypothetical protein
MPTRPYLLPQISTPRSPSPPSPPLPTPFHNHPLPTHPTPCYNSLDCICGQLVPHSSPQVDPRHISQANQVQQYIRQLLTHVRPVCRTKIWEAWGYLGVCVCGSRTDVWCVHQQIERWTYTCTLVGHICVLVRGHRQDSCWLTSTQSAGLKSGRPGNACVCGEGGHKCRRGRQQG